MKKSVPSQSTLSDLLRRVETLEGPDPAIDCLLWEIWGWKGFHATEYSGLPVDPDTVINGETLSQAITRCIHTDPAGIARCWHIPRFTGNTDYARQLNDRLFPGWQMNISIHTASLPDDDDECFVSIENYTYSHNSWHMITNAVAPTLPVAIIISMLQALMLALGYPVIINGKTFNAPKNPVFGVADDEI